MFRRTLMVALILAGYALSAGSADAACRRAPRSGLTLAPYKAGAFRPWKAPDAPKSASGAANDDSIVGFWHVRFLLPADPPVVFDEGFDQFHSDGTEVLNDTAPPQPANGSGTVCLGVYQQTGPGTYQLKHPFWIFDEQGAFAGTGFFRETITVDDAATYHGSFLYVTYDLDGVETDREEGRLEADRITADD